MWNSLTGEGNILNIIYIIKCVTVALNLWQATKDIKQNVSDTQVKYKYIKTVHKVYLWVDLHWSTVYTSSSWSMTPENNQQI